MKVQTTTKSQKSDRTNHSQSAATKATPQTPTHELLRMQQTVGNRAVSQLIQTKLKVGKPGDVYEREADRVADRVTQMPNSQARVGMTNNLSIQPLSIQRMSSEDDTVSRMAMEEDKPVQTKAEDEEKPVQMKEEDESVQMKEEDEPVQMKEEDEPVQMQAIQNSPKTSPTIENRLSSRQQGGTPLAPDTRNFMESRFGHNFADVRVHTDSTAVQMNQDLHAHAFTHQHNIYFNQGQYNPESSGGKRLLAHELTHVVQQTGSSGGLQTKEMPGATAPTPPSPTVETASPTPTATTEPASAPPPRTQETKAKQKPQKPEEKPPEEAPEMAATPEAAAPTAPPQGASGDGLLMPEPPATLSAKDSKRVKGVQGKATANAKEQAKLPDAAANVSGARKAVTEPAAEAQAKAGEKLVTTLSAKQPPSPEIIELCEKIKKAIREKRPTDEAGVVKSNPQQVAQKEGDRVNSAVEGDAKKVQGNYNQLQTPPQAAPPQPAPPVESPPATVETPAPGAQAAVPSPVPAKNVSLDADVAAGQKSMEDAGMNSEAAKLVTTGPVAEARAAHGELAETAQQAPAQVMAEQQAALDKANGDMLALQQAAMTSLASSRTTTVGGVSNQQKGMVETEEQTRDRIGKEAQSIFDNAQKRVNKLLEPLPKTAMEQWETGVKIASGEFERHLNQVKKWIEERHEGGWGSVVKIWDRVTGLPGWITDAYNKAEEAFGEAVCTLIKKISSDVNTVIKSCEDIIDNARKDITKLFADLPASLKEWAAGEQAKFAQKLDTLKEKAKETRNNFNRDLSNRANAAVEEVRAKIQALREEAKGMLGRFADAVGRFLDDPLRAIIDGLLNIVGIPPASFWALVAKIEQVIGDIVKDPINFANNLLKGLAAGFQQFFDHIGTHLQKGLFEWLFSKLDSVGVEIPKDFSLESIVTFFLQLMGISWAKIRKLLAKHIGEKNIALLEKAFQLIATFIELGPEGILELLKEQLNPANLLQQVLDAAINIFINTLVKQVTARIILLFNPAGAIAQAVEAIYRVLKWVFENAAKLFSFVETVVNGIANVISGNISGMATAVEMALAKVIAPVIDFLAGYAGLGDLPQQIADVIKGFQDWIEGILDEVIGWLVEKGKKLLGIGGKDKKDENSHAALAEQAKTELQKVDEGEDKDYEKLRAKKEEQAKQIEQTYTDKLEEGIKLTITFNEATADQEDQDIDFEVIIAPNDSKKKGAISSASRKIGIIEIPREKMRWHKATKVAVAKKFLEIGGKASVVDKSGKIKTKRKWARRHIISFANMRKHYEVAFHDELLVSDAVKILEKFGLEASPTRKSVHSNIKKLVRKAFNDPTNLWIGEQATNSSIQEWLDPGPGLVEGVDKRLQQKIDEHIQAFLEKWGVPGVPFEVTDDPNITGTIEWEITEIGEE